MMLEPTLQALKNTRVVLASNSPRRQEIIKKLGINVEVIPSTYDENLDRSKYANTADYVQDLARFKVQEVYRRIQNDSSKPLLIIGADTLVALDDIIYGKPKNEANAFKMLSSLANKEHIVYTGVCVKTSNEEISFCQCTQVKFGEISDKQVEAYIKTGEPFDKAGGYGLQGIGACLIEKVNGDYYGVMGMPIYPLVKRLNEIFSNKI